MSGILFYLTSNNLAGDMFAKMNALNELGYGSVFRRAGDRVAQLILAHHIRFEPLDLASMARSISPSEYLQKLNALVDALSPLPDGSSNVICELLEALWLERPDIAAWLDGNTLFFLAALLGDVHQRFVLGCKDYLNHTLPPGWTESLDATSCVLKISEVCEVYTQAVQGIPLDGGHWHELWLAGPEIAICLMEHFLYHEDMRSARWNPENVGNPASYLNRNLQNLREHLGRNPAVCMIMRVLRRERPDIAYCIDGRCLQSIAENVWGDQALLQCAAYLVQTLPPSWRQTAANPKAVVQRRIDAFISSMR